MSAAHRNGTTIKVVEFQHEDWTRAWEVQIIRGRIRMLVPTWVCKDEAGARRIANAAYRAAATLTDPLAIRTAAMTEVAR